MSHRTSKRRRTVDYTQIFAEFDDAIEPPKSTGYDILEIVRENRYHEHQVVQRMASSEFTLDFLHRSGFKTPLLFEERTYLGMTIPDPSFTVSDVKSLVGSSRVVDVMDVSTQDALTMTMGEWTEYYNSPDKKDLLNVISLEFSNTKLDKRVQSPSLIRQIDWVDNAWPRHLKLKQKATTNDMSQMMYPKVQKYCLMSVGGCYTDFHVDFGGSSVWYHVLRGSKIFYLIKPTPENLQKFAKWSNGEDQSDVFFGDLCPSDCSKVCLKAGDTFMIPSGWIHGVYTPSDALVFGGNFLHNFAIPEQLDIAALERRLRVPIRYRFPFFEAIFWYAAINFHERMKGAPVMNGLSSFEMEGLKMLLGALSTWHVSPHHQRNIPESLQNPAELIDQLSSKLELHKNCPTSPSGTVTVTSPKVNTAPKMPRSPPKRKVSVSEKDPSDKSADMYAQLKTVRQYLRAANPSISEEELTALCKKRWKQLPQQSRSAFRDMFRNKELLSSAVSGVMSKNPNQALSTSDRSSKYQRKSWHAPKQMVKLAKNLKAMQSLPSKPATTKSPEKRPSFSETERKPVPVKSENRPRKVIAQVNLGDLYSLPGLASDIFDKPAPKAYSQPCTKLTSGQIRNGQREQQQQQQQQIQRQQLQKPSVNQGGQVQPHGHQRSYQSWPFMQPQYYTILPSSPIIGTGIASNSTVIPTNLSKVAPVHDLGHVLPSPDTTPGVSQKAALHSQSLVCKWAELPKPIWLRILQYLNQEDIRKCGMVCRRLYDICDDPLLWHVVDFSYCQLRSTNISKLARQQPQRLELRWSSITNQQLESVFLKVSSLEEISLTGCRKVTRLPANIQQSGLKSLQLNFVANLVDMSYIDMLPSSLLCLGLAGSPITDEQLMKLADKCSHLEAIDLYQCYRVSSVGLSYFLSRSAHLYHMDLRDNPIDDDGLLAVIDYVRRNPTRRRPFFVDVRGCNGTSEALFELASVVRQAGGDCVSDYF